MVEGQSEMSGWRFALNIVGAMLGMFVALGAGGCHREDGGEDDVCRCFRPPNVAAIHLGCLPIEPPVVKTTGPCSVCPVVLANGSIPDGAHCAVSHYSQDIELAANGAGTCHVELTFGSGATSSVDLDFISQWAACGSDPHGCGEGFVAANADGSAYIQVAVPEPICDAGLGADASD
jgi:hypothetical protein